ncbi:hypothetical protein [Streptomyces sp. C36]|uniref:hypothetical protein n=1 Tax=Streptomyces sp. C36 TaxID=3237122 RepID=UPI0034C647B2
MTAAVLCAVGDRLVDFSEDDIVREEDEFLIRFTLSGAHCETAGVGRVTGECAGSQRSYAGRKGFE